MFRAIRQLLASTRGSVSGWAHGGERSWEDSGQPTASQCAQAAQQAQAAQHPQTAQATQVEAGRRRLWAHKKLSLRRMIVLTVVAVVFVLAGTIGCLSTWALEASLMDRADIRVQAASQRGNTRRHSESTEKNVAQQLLQTYGSDSSDYNPPAGLDAPGQAAGTLALLRNRQGVVASAYINNEGKYTYLTRDQINTLMAALNSGKTKPFTVYVEGLGTYRVLITRDSVSSDAVLTGVSLADDEALIGRQMMIEVLLVGSGVVLAAVVCFGLVSRFLQPLRRVAATARQVATQPMDSGEVQIERRVSLADLCSSTEVGEVGTALNTLLDHVNDALEVRQRSETQVRQFVADASHELRTPLAAIRGYTELVRSGREGDQLSEISQQAMDRIASESLRMSELVNDLLLLARLDAGRELEDELVDLAPVLIESVADAQIAGPDHTFELDLSAVFGADEDLDEQLPLVRGDEQRLRQVLANLLANARLHTPAGTHVWVKLLQEGDEYRIVVADSGPGISPQLRGKLFERFTRADASRNRQGGSTGLGLAICAAIAQAHGGSVQLADSAQYLDDAAQGACFVLSLPVAS
ncbi:sensor histidine kinase [Actinomyces graevenitzii]|uniref:sensor histidine kinase n=1 Tax=Actinomyces graevenitzii TaxID=55565 RepID=UPI0011AF4608|nr:HAMP domain-containing sensor histidine kinase [Actinomyces graevenitzii]